MEAILNAHAHRGGEREIHIPKLNKMPGDISHNCWTFNILSAIFCIYGESVLPLWYIGAKLNGGQGVFYWHCNIELDPI